MKNKINQFPFISIVFPNWNGKEVTLECISSLQKLNYPKDKLEIIISDNGSTDGSQTAIRKKFKEIKNEGWFRLYLIENKKNIGAPAAYNKGIREANPEYEYIWKLDNDVVVDPNSLIELIKIMEDNKEIGISGSKVYYYQPKDLIQSAGARINLWLGRFSPYGIRQRDKNSSFNKIKKVDYVSGCSMLIKKEVIEKIGLLDERYFVYFDETDFCLRAKRAGFDIVYVPTSKIWHKQSATTNKISGFSLYYMTRNRFLFEKKFATKFQYLFFILYFLLWRTPRKIIRIAIWEKNWKLVINFIKGIIKGLRTKP